VGRDRKAASASGDAPPAHQHPRHARTARALGAALSHASASCSNAAAADRTATGRNQGPLRRRERVRALFDAVGLTGQENTLDTRLSGGQQQRVAVARALINQPRVVLADEPTGNLDSTTGEEIIQLLLGLRDRYDTTVLVATHDLDLAKRCDNVVHIRDGRITNPTLDIVKLDFPSHGGDGAPRRAVKLPLHPRARTRPRRSQPGRGGDRSRELQLPTRRHVGRVKFVRWVDDAHSLVKAVSHGDESCRCLPRTSSSA
jgi:energy-coupling factor transporter ATP-binding protein EcfA2